MSVTKIRILTVFLFAFVTHNSNAQEDIFFSEYIMNGWTNCIEIFNPTSDTIDLSVYSITRNGSYDFHFPPSELKPFEIWCACRNDEGHPPPPEVQEVIDTSWAASGSIWYFGDNARIELLRNDTVIDRINADPAEPTVAGISSALSYHTLIRKPSILDGETNWDISRGSNEEDSQWLVSAASFSDLGTHTIDLINPALDTSTVITSTVYNISFDTVFIPSDLPLDTVIKYLGFPENGDYMIFDILGNAIVDGLVTDNTRLKVISEAGTSEEYIILSDENPDTRIDIESLVYYFHEGTITNIEEGTDPSTILNSLILSPGLTPQIRDYSGSLKTGPVYNGDILRITAPDGTTTREWIIITHPDVPAHGDQLYSKAKTRKIPLGAPRYSDVNFTSRWPRKTGLRSGPEALPAAQSFHVTNFRWVYITAQPSLYYPGTDSWIENDIKGKGFKLSASLNPLIDDFPRGEGNGLDSRAELADGSEVDIFCPNKPGGRQAFMNHVQTAIDMGSDFSIQMDDPHFYLGGSEICHCEYCQKKAGEWNMTAGTELFYEKSLVEFWKWVQAETIKLTGTTIGYSCNNTSNHVFDEVTKEFDFMIGECDPRWSYGPYFYFDDERNEAERFNKMQVFNLSVKGLVIEDPTLVWRNRSMIGLSYGIGGNCIVPWDSWMHPPIEERRYFGSPEEYADLFGFIRANSRFLEGYEHAFDYMPEYDDNRFGGVKPVYVSENDRTFAYVRAIPEDSIAPVVIHLVDWKESPEKQAMKIHILPEYFFSGESFGIFLVKPTEYSEKLHADVIAKANSYLEAGTFRGPEHEAVYAPLRDIQKLAFQRQSGKLIVELDSIPAYSMLVLVPESSPAMISSDYYNVTESDISGYASGQTTSSFLDKINRNPVCDYMILDEEGKPVYNEIPENARLILKSPDNRKIAEYALNKGKSSGISVTYKENTVEEGTVVELDPVAVDEPGEGNTFSIKNTSSETIYIDTIIANDADFAITYSFESIEAGESVEFEISYGPSSRGVKEIALTIHNNDKSLLPYGFRISSEGLAPEIRILNNGDFLQSGTHSIELGPIKIEHDTLFVLDVMNTGKDTLIIEDIRTDISNTLTIETYDTSIPPQGTGKLNLRYGPSMQNFEIVELSILSNDPVLEDYRIYVKGSGMPLEPEIIVMHNDSELAPETGIVDFANVGLDSTHNEKVIIKNTGVDNLYVSNITSSLSQFIVMNNPDTIAPGSSDTLFISFTPDIQLSFSGKISFATNDQGLAEYSFIVKGNGISYVGFHEKEIPDLSIYPNPAEDFIQIILSGSFDVRMYNLRGDMVRSISDCSDLIEINLSDMSGIKIVEIITKNEIIRRKVLIK